MTACIKVRYRDERNPKTLVKTPPFYMQLTDECYATHHQ